MTKNMKKTEAEAVASKVKSKDGLKDLIVEQACKLVKGEVNDVQLIMAAAKRFMAIK